ncbi:MAG: hypothetical protein AAGU11_02335 [Syntrophobacteraceae bacterium]
MELICISDVVDAYLSAAGLDESKAEDRSWNSQYRNGKEHDCSKVCGIEFLIERQGDICRALAAVGNFGELSAGARRLPCAKGCRDGEGEQNVPSRSTCPTKSIVGAGPL